jgi:hypothetical protein
VQFVCYNGNHTSYTVPQDNIANGYIIFHT